MTMPASQGDAGHLWPSTEQQLLLDAALLDGEKAIAAFRAWRGGIDLEAEFPGSWLRLLPAVYDNLKSLGFSDPLMGRLRGVYRRAWYENHVLFHRVAPLTQALHSRGIDVLVLKGAALVTDYYGNHALRPMSDLDLWVPQRALPDTLAVLREAGWRFGVDPTADHIRFHRAVQCFGPDGGELDLHWHVFWERSRHSFNAFLWERTEPINFQGVPLRQLDASMLLLHTVTHGVRWNVETPVRWIADAVMILRRRGHDLDWNCIIDVARQARMAFRLHLGLSYLAARYGGVPQSVLDRLDGTRPTLLERIDNSVVLRGEAAYHGSALKQQWVTFTEYCRSTPADSVGQFISGYPHYLRYRWQLDGRREIPRVIWRGLRRRLGRKLPDDVREGAA